MRICGVRIEGRMVWADAADHEVVVLDQAMVRIGSQEHLGTVFVAPEQLLRPPGAVVGVVVRRQLCARLESGCDELPGSELPPLGTRARSGELEGTVIGIDPIERTVTVAVDESDERITLSISDLSAS